MGAALVKIIDFALRYFIVKTVVTLGIALFSYAAIDALIKAAINYAVTYLNQLPQSVLQLLVIAGADQALSIICSAILTASTIHSAKIFIGKQ